MSELFPKQVNFFDNNYLASNQQQVIIQIGDEPFPDTLYHKAKAAI